MYSVRLRKLTPEVIDVGFPRAARGRRRALSWGCGGGGLSRA